MRRLVLTAVGVALAFPAAAAEPRSPFQKVFVPGTVRVQFFPWTTPEQVEAVLAEHGLVPVGGPAGGAVVARTSGEDAWHAAARLNRSPFVDWAVPHYVLRRSPPAPGLRIRPQPARP